MPMAQQQQHFGLAPVMPYGHTQVTRPYSGEIEGYDTFGRPIYRPISPYDAPKAPAPTPAHTTHDPDLYPQEHALAHQPAHATSRDQPAEMPGQHAEQRPQQEAQPQTQPQTLGLEPLYGQLTDPYSEIGQGFFNPYLQRK